MQYNYHDMLQPLLRPHSTWHTSGVKSLGQLARLLFKRGFLLVRFNRVVPASAIRFDNVLRMCMYAGHYREFFKLRDRP
jgi:hypothetical protein